MDGVADGFRAAEFRLFGLDGGTQLDFPLLDCIGSLEDGEAEPVRDKPGFGGP